MQDPHVKLTHLYEQHNRAVRAYCMRRTNDVDVADALAEVFTVAWRKVDQIPDGEMALAWLYGVARRVLSTQHRSQRRRMRLTERLSSVRHDEPPQPERQIVERTEYRLVRMALAGLRPHDREVLLLAAWEELPNNQIAEVLGCTTEAAAQRLHRARKRLGAAYRALTTTTRPPTVAEGGERR